MRDIDPNPPAPVHTAVMLQRWHRLTFIHWPYDPSVIRAHIPRGLNLDLWEGRAWVSMTPFLLRDLHPPALPAVPWLSEFPETNLRTYVTNSAGRPGIWFFSLEAARLAAVLAARATYGLPYMWSNMTIEDRGPSIAYSGRRRWPRPEGAGYDVEVKIGSAIPAADVTNFDRFLTARFRLYSRIAGRLAFADVEHPPWPLASACLSRITQSLTSAAGLPEPESAPLAQFSEGVDTRIGMIRFA